jgi:hypothetical protein
VIEIAIFQFYQIYRSINEELGEDMAIKIFPEYSNLPEKMSAKEQAKLGNVLMERMDDLLDKNTISKIRRKHCCNIPKEHIIKINELKDKHVNLEDILRDYSEFLTPGFVTQNGNTLNVSFGLDKCICGMFRKLEIYESISKSWCECCNGHVIKTFSYICDKIVSSEIVESIACGGEDCVFKVNI